MRAILAMPALAAACLVAPAGANAQAMNSFPAAHTPDGSEQIPAVQDGHPVELTPAQIAAVQPVATATSPGEIPALTSAQIPIGQAGSVTAETISGDATLGALGALTVTKTNGVAFVPLATGTSAASLTGTLGAGQLIKADRHGLVSAGRRLRRVFTGDHRCRNRLRRQ
jgi:hypothetical protein